MSQTPADPPPNDDIPLASSTPTHLASQPLAQRLRATPVSADFHCVQCGYNLRGLPRNHHCPECGRAVQDSYHGDRLDFADPAWVRSLALGALLAQLAFAAAFIAVLLHTYFQNAVPACTLWAALVILAPGIWLLTGSEPRVVAPAMPTAKATRIASACAVAAASALLLWGGSLPASLTLFSLAAGSVSLGLHLYKLAKRTPDDSVANSLNNVGWAAAAIFVLFAFVIGLVGQIPHHPDLTAGLFILCLPPAFLFAIPLAAWTLTLHLFWRDLRNCARAQKKK